MKQADFFYRLTPDEIIDAVVKLGLEPSGHISQLNSMENRVFDLRLDDGRHMVAKFYRPGRWTQEQIFEEHEFLADLKTDEIPALAPIEIAGKTLFEEQGIFFAMWERTGGREPEELSEIDLQILGRLLARLHNSASSRPMLHRPGFSTERFLHEPLRELLHKKFLTPNFIAEYEILVEIISKAYEQRAAHLPQIRIHGDLHKGNILNGVDGWFLLDFDDSLMGPALQDVWMLFAGKSEAALRARATFLEAYREFRDFADSWLSAAEVLRAMRIVHYSGWIARRYEDPSFKSAFPDFASDAYWQEEIDILREICLTFQDDTTGLISKDEKLSNSDFFFDWDNDSQRNER